MRGRVRTKILALLLGLALVSSLTALGMDNPCLENIENMLSGKASSPSEDRILLKASEVMKANLTQEQKASLKRANQACAENLCSAEELQAQEIILKQADFSEADIKLFRKEGVLSNSKLAWSEDTIPGVEIEKNALKQFTPDLLRAARNGAKFSYVIDAENHLMLIEGEFDMKGDHVLVLRERGKDGPVGVLVVKESGLLEIDKKNGAAKFNPSPGSDISPEEAEQIRLAIEKDHPEQKFEKGKDPVKTLERILDCTRRRSVAGNFRTQLRDAMISEGIVTAAAIGFGEMTGAKRWKTEKGRKVIATKFIGGGIGASVLTPVGFLLTKNKVGAGIQLGVRAGISLGLIQINKEIVEGLVGGQEGKKTSEKIATFDNWFFAGRIVPRILFEKFMLNRLPEIVESACLKGSILRIVLNPTAVRIYEKTGANVIYYGLSKATIDE